MKNLFTILAMFLVSLTINAQFTTGIKSYTLENGQTVKKGIKIKISSDIGKNFNQATWVYYGRKKLPVPVTKFSPENANQVFTVEKVVKMRGIKDEAISTLIVFSHGKKKCYAHVVKAVQDKEITIL